MTTRIVAVFLALFLAVPGANAQDDPLSSVLGGLFKRALERKEAPRQPPDAYSDQYPESGDTEYPADNDRTQNTNFDVFGKILESVLKGRSTEQAPEDGTNQYPVDGTASYPDDEPEQYPGSGTASYPGDTPGQYPESGAAPYPSDSSGQYPASGTASYPANTPSPAPQGNSVTNIQDAVSDQASYEAALGKALEFNRSGTSARWENPQTGRHGDITPTRTLAGGAAPCREYDSTLVTGGRTLDYAGTACRAGPAQWTIREEKGVAPKTASRRWVSPDAAK